MLWCFHDLLIRNLGVHDGPGKDTDDTTSQGWQRHDRSAVLNVISLAHRGSRLEKALADSKTCAVFVGPDGLGDWHEEEMRTASSRRVSEKSSTFRVITVLLPESDPANRDQLPAFMQSPTWVDFRNSLGDETART